MRAALRSVVAALALAAALVAAPGCSFLHDGYPGDECETTSDCFKDRETCNTTTGRCEAIPPRADAAPTIDAPPPPDAGPDATPADAGVDAEIADAGVDAT